MAGVAVLIGLAALVPSLPAAVRLSGPAGSNQFDNRVRFLTTGGFALPDGDWTIGIWDNYFQGNGGWLIATNVPTATTSTLSLCFDKTRGRYVVGGMDSAGNAFGSAGTVSGVAGTLPGGYASRITGKFTPRLHIIRRRAGYSEYLVAEGGHAPVLVSSQQRTFVGFPLRNWWIGCHSEWAELYDGDVEGFFFAPAAVSDRDIALMAAGQKPTSSASLNGNVPAYFPLETAQLATTTNPLALGNQGNNSSIGLNRMGPVTRFWDGPMLRGATVENNTPAQVTEPTNVVALNSFQPFQIIRHLNGSADVRFTGFDYGTDVADIQIRFIDVEHATATPWQPLLTGSVGGTAIDVTVPVPKGYWKTIETRRVNSVGGTGNSNRPNRTWSRWAVGEVVVVWGDSIQGQVESTGRASIVAANGFTAKYPSTYPNTIPSDTNPLYNGMWNLLGGVGMGGGTQGENEIANNLSAASQSCVGITVVWAGATRLAYWNGRLGSTPYTGAKALCLANGGLNKPNVITWVTNLASAKYNDDFYDDLERFKTALNADFGEGTWRLVVAPTPVIFSPEPVTPSSLHIVREATSRWVQDNVQCAAFGGIFFDHLTYDGVHPEGAAWNIMGPRWGNAVAHLRAPSTYADPRGGEIEKFYRSGGNLLVKVKLFAGTALSLKDPAVNISGFTVSSDNFTTTIPLSSVTLVNGTTVKIVPSSPLPGGPLKLRYLFGRPGSSGTTLAALGADNMLYVNAGPTNLIAIQPIYGTSSSSWALVEGAAPPAPSVSWQGNQFTPAEITGGQASMTGDFDMDGVPTLLEYAFGGNPRLQDAALITPVAGVEGDQLQISFHCDANCTDVTYTVQASETLEASSWTDIARSIGGALTLPVGALSNVADAGAGRRLVTVTDATPISTVSRRFLRVNIEETTP